ncbi:MAG TPA: arsenite methyltransferase [Actinophytocola sp.]|nr:arsenite methyltransferase [Actinophytocola sp.]
MPQDAATSAHWRDVPFDPSLRDVVREHYAAAARRSAAGCCTDRCRGTTPDAAAFGGDLYGDEASGAPAEAVSASLGCGVPTAVAELHPGDTVLDLGSGAGIDVLISARRVGPRGRVIGLDMTAEMLDLARRNAALAGVDNVEFVQGYLEQIPLPDASVDVVISNCVINLAADKTVVLAETARVLRPGGRFAVSDVVADPDLDQATRDDADQWTGCVAGALTREDYEGTLRDAGFVDVDTTETHRVHPHAVSAMLRARVRG